MDHKRFPKGDDSLLSSRNGSLENQEIILDNPVVWETTHRRDALLGDIRLRRSVGIIIARADPVNFFVEFCTMVIAV